ncbi:MAG TPA: hypothetical protein VFC78_24810 [Tepidisphaeraceae bacterium]|nr:hypothetical protein [Tepidisphaeraceae bacterium]
MAFHRGFIVGFVALNIVALALFLRLFGFGGWEMSHYGIALAFVAVAMAVAEIALCERFFGRYEPAELRSRMRIALIAIPIALAAAGVAYWINVSDQRAQEATRRQQDADALERQRQEATWSGTAATMQRLKAAGAATHPATAPASQ